jgi:hypothetical protein
LFYVTGGLAVTAQNAAFMFSDTRGDDGNTEAGTFATTKVGSVRQGLCRRRHPHRGKVIDEDWGVKLRTGVNTGYSNTVGDASGQLSYATADIGYDIVRGPGYKVGAFVGYNIYTENKTSTSCYQIALSASGFCSPGITTFILGDNDEWRSLRVGANSQVMLNPLSTLDVRRGFPALRELQGAGLSPAAAIPCGGQGHWNRRTNGSVSGLPRHAAVEHRHRWTLLVDVDHQRFGMPGAAEWTLSGSAVECAVQNGALRYDAPDKLQIRPITLDIAYSPSTARASTA